MFYHVRAKRELPACLRDAQAPHRRGITVGQRLGSLARGNHALHTRTAHVMGVSLVAKIEVSWVLREVLQDKE